MHRMTPTYIDNYKSKGTHTCPTCAKSLMSSHCIAFVLCDKMVASGRLWLLNMFKIQRQHLRTFLWTFAQCCTTLRWLARLLHEISKVATWFASLCARVLYNMSHMILQCCTRSDATFWSHPIVQQLWKAPYTPKDSELTLKTRQSNTALIPLCPKFVRSTASRFPPTGHLKHMHPNNRKMTLNTRRSRYPICSPTS